MGDLPLISEHKFSSGYTSFWRTALPLGEAFVRQMNGRREKFAEPFDFDLTPDRSALVSETSFRLLIEGGLTRVALVASHPGELSTASQAALEASAYLSKLKGSHPIAAELHPHELEIVFRLAERLRRFLLLEESDEPIIARPRFDGCGIVESCEGDILAGTVLYEIKNVERSFRLVDVRQVLTYCALNSAKETHRITGVGWVNARSGKFFRMGLGPLASKIAGSSAPELLSDIVSFISMDTPSTQ